MPHWYGIIAITSPPLLQSCGGDPNCVREKVMENAPQGVNVRFLFFHRGENHAGITVEGKDPAAHDYLVTDLEAQDVVELD